MGTTNWSLKVLVELSSDWAKSSDCVFSGHSTTPPLRRRLIACCVSILACVKSRICRYPANEEGRRHALNICKGSDRKLYQRLLIRLLQLHPTRENPRAHRDQVPTCSRVKILLAHVIRFSKATAYWRIVIPHQAGFLQVIVTFPMRQIHSTSDASSASVGALQTSDAKQSDSAKQKMREVVNLRSIHIT